MKISTFLIWLESFYSNISEIPGFTVGETNFFTGENLDKLDYFSAV